MNTLNVTRSLVGVLAIISVTPGLSRAQLMPARPVILYPWGAFTRPGSGVTAKVAASAGLVRQQSQTTGAAPLAWVNFSIPSTYVGQSPQQDQAVYLSADGRVAGFSTFPIKPPEANQCVGRGAANGCFSMRTFNVMVSNTGIINGTTKITSDDDLDGFSGNVEIFLLKKDGNVVWMQHAGCWGVNVRSGREVVWNFTPVRDSLLQAATVQVFQYHDTCGRDRAKAFFDELQAGAQAAAPIVQVLVSSSGK
jgi:hypothetical protein